MQYCIESNEHEYVGLRENNTRPSKQFNILRTLA